jgi:hypothetical protein
MSDPLNPIEFSNRATISLTMREYAELIQNAIDANQLASDYQRAASGEPDPYSEIRGVCFTEHKKRALSAQLVQGRLFASPASYQLRTQCEHLKISWNGVCQSCGRYFPDKIRS